MHPSLAISVSLVEIDSSFNIIDIRQSEDFKELHINGAMNLIDPESILDLALKNPESKFLLHCYHGYTASIYGNFLVENGAKNIYYFDGNFEDIYEGLNKQNS